MARANDKENCFIFTWVIENFSIFLGSDNRWLRINWKTEESEDESEWGMTLWATRNADGWCQDVKLYVYKYNTILNRDKCDLSFVSTSGEVTLIRKERYFLIENHAIFGDKGKFNLPRDTLTIYCKVWGLKTPNFSIRSIMHKVNWDVGAFCSNELCNTFFVGNENFQLHIIVFKSTEFRETHTVYVGKVPNGDYSHSFVDCKINHGRTLFDRYINDYKEWLFGIAVSGENHASREIPLQLECVIAVHSKMPPQTSTLENVRNAAPKTLVSDLLRLLKDETLSDATLHTEERSFPVHRAILAARSPVFRAMFEQRDAVEGRSGVVEIDDIDSATVDRMLGFLYGDDSIGNVSWEEASALYYAADKYDVPLLKNECFEILKAGLTVLNVCSAIALADKHSDEELLKSAVDFILRHEEVVSSTEWENLEAENCRLTSKILRELFVRRREIIDIK